MLASLASSMAERILGRWASNTHGVFIRGGCLIQTSRGRLLDLRRLFESGRL